MGKLGKRTTKRVYKVEESWKKNKQAGPGAKLFVTIFSAVAKNLEGKKRIKQKREYKRPAKWMS